MADEALGVRGRCLLLMMHAERVGVEIRFHVKSVALWDVSDESHRIRVTGGTVGHPDRRGNRPGRIVALHAIQHLRQSQIRKTLAVGNRVMASGAVEIVLRPDLKVRGVGKNDIFIFSARDFLRLETPAFGKAGILDFLRIVAIPATSSRHRRDQLWSKPRLRMADGAFLMAGERPESPGCFELVAGRAIRAKSSLGVEAGLWIHV